MSEGRLDCDFNVDEGTYYSKSFFCFIFLTFYNMIMIMKFILEIHQCSLKGGVKPQQLIT